MSSTASLLTCRPRWATPRRPERPTYGPKVAKVAATLGTPFMPWQQQVADIAGEVDPDTGELAYREIVLTVPRQSGKTTLILAEATHRALGFGGPQRITYTAQSRNDARQKWEDEHVPALDRSAIGRHKPTPYRVRKTNGNEAVLWRNGSKYDISANTEKSGHGGTRDLAFLDEAFSHVDARLEQAFKPSMITRRSPQLWVVSTAGTPESLYLWSKVENGRARVERGITSGVAYFEWSADDDADPGALATWRSCMPALGHTITAEAIAADFASMELDEFCRAYLNLWGSTKGPTVIPEADWKICSDDTSRPTDPVCLAFDVTPDRSAGAIGVASPTAAGNMHVEVADHRAGTSWMVDRIAGIVERQRPKLILCDAAGPAGALLTKLESKRVNVRVVNTREHAQACGALLDDVLEHRLRHIGQEPLDAAVKGAAKREVADSWLWSRKSSSVDISPLVAVTLARYGATTRTVDVAASVH